MTQKIFISKTGKANFVCPECGKAQQMDVSKFAKAAKEVKLKCKCTCQHVFSVILERRMSQRKTVDFSGNLILEGENYPIKVTDISRCGLKIRTKEPLALNLEDQIIVDFILDDSGHSKISKQVVVKKINETNIGAEFVSSDHYDKLGPYLLFNFN
ncbi:MAG: PilZ domain-containing protein [Desulfobacteraceae bacterium]|nr:PilZ domain-containing protein [Desulfobacteraceae bacterium]